MAIKYDVTKFDIAKKNVKNSERYISEALSSAQIIKRDTPVDLNLRGILYQLPVEVGKIRDRINGVTKLLVSSESRVGNINSILSGRDLLYGMGTLNVGVASIPISNTIYNSMNQNVEFLKSLGNDIADTGANVVSGIGNGIKEEWNKSINAISTACDWSGQAITDAWNWSGQAISDAWNWSSNAVSTACNWSSQAVTDAWNWTSQAATDAWKWICGAADDTWEFLKKLGATIMVGLQSLLKGIGEFLEAIMDLLFLVGSGIGTIGTEVADFITWTSTGEWGTATSDMWKWTMSFVATKWVDNFFASLYKDTGYGQWLNNHSWMNSDSTAANIISGIGYVAGVIALTIVTFGAGGAATAAGGTATSAAVNFSAEGAAIIATGAGIGKGTEEKWDEMKTASEQSGDPDSWLTTDNLFKGLEYGGLNGLWEGVQWYLGGKLGTAVFFKGSGSILSKLGDSGIRLALNTGTGAIETPARSLINMVYNGKTFEENWNELGGWNGVLTNGGIAFFSQIVGEGFELKKAIKANKLNETVDLNVNTNMETNAKPVEDAKIENNSIKTDMDQIAKLNGYNSIVSNAKKALSEVSERLVAFYELSKVSGKKLAFFLGFEEHNFAHVYRVAQESKAVLNEFNKLIDSGIIKGYTKIDPDLVYKAGLGHDLGMISGGYEIVEGNLKLIEDAYGKIVRSKHPLNSAITILKNKDIFGEDSEIVACLALLHSKSTSGVRHLSSLFELSSTVKQLYEIGLNEKIYGFDISKLVKCNAEGIPILKSITENGKVVEVFDFQDGIAEQLRTGAAALRIGDARALKTGFNHGGGSIVINKLPDVEYTLLNPTENLNILCEREALDANVEIVYDDGKFELSGGDYDYSKAVVLGESNTTSIPAEIVDNVLVYREVVKTANSPACTWRNSILEKFGEYKTFNDVPQKVVIELPNGSSSELINFYKTQALEYMNSDGKGWLDIEVIVNGGN